MEKMQRSNSTILPDFRIRSTGKISEGFIKKDILSFKEAADWVRSLPYGRNADKNDLTTVFSDGCGTCSTKHALLKQLAIENDFEGLQLVIGLFKMNGNNTPEAAAALARHGLSYIPEAHNYLKYNDAILDYTKPTFDPAGFVNDIIKEIEIMPDQIADFKVTFHKDYLNGWLGSNPGIKLTLSELWSVREECIRDLAADPGK